MPATVAAVPIPPPAQVLGVLYNAVFLDLIDQDILRLELIHRLLRDLPEERRHGMRRVEIFVLRPSRDLGRMARPFEPRLPGSRGANNFRLDNIC